MRGIGSGRRSLLYADEVSPQRQKRDGENQKEKHNPTLIAGEDFAAAPTFIVRRFVFQFQRITTGKRAVRYIVRLAETSAPR